MRCRWDGRVTGPWLLLLAVLLHATRANSPRCRIRCGVISELAGSTNTRNFVQSVWDTLRQQRSLRHVSIVFVDIEPRRQQTMSELLDAYVNIGSANASVVIGEYMQPVATATERHGIPYFVTSDMKRGQYRPYNVISIYPKLSDIYKISLHIVDRYKWKEIAVFYDSVEGLYFLEGLLQFPDIYVRTWRLGNQSLGDIRHFLLDVRQLAIRNIVLLTSPTITQYMLQEGLKLSMMSSVHSWMIPNLVRDDASLLPYAYSRVNLTTFRLAESAVPGGEWRGQQHSEREYDTVHDSLLTLHHAVTIHHRNTHDCLWTGRDNIQGTLAHVHDHGATGYLSFTRDSTRHGPQVDIMGLSQAGLTKVGLWNASRGPVAERLALYPPVLNQRDNTHYPLGKDAVSVVTIIEDPFVRLKSDAHSRVGNDRFEGFCIDLLEKIARTIGFRYTIYLVPDGQYGEKERDGSWNGLIGELVSGNASLVVAALSITSSREMAIDFTKPFKADGISIVMRRPAQKSSFFQFTEPLHWTVWLMMLGVFFFTSIAMYLLDKVAPPPEDCVRFTALESFWFTFASMMLSGTEIHPRTVAARMLAGALWLFSLIIISTYTASLAAHLTVSKFDSNIRSLFDLLDQSKVSYGTVSNSDVGAFFQNSQILRFKNLWQIMSELNPDCMVNNSNIGFERARSVTDDYAFIWDTPAVKFQVENDCNLMAIGEPIGSRAYGIGVPLGAQYRDEISMAILKMAESGEIGSMEHRWWTSPVKCPDAERAKPSKMRSLSVEKVGGVFMILGIGTGLAIILAIVDYVVRVRQSSCTRNRRVPDKSAPRNHYDGVPAARQQEEPFLGREPKKAKGPARKQTNIF